jgi:threonine aldolase
VSRVPIIDLRSDTFTSPTPEMRAAMAAAEVGDDVYGEDPTVRQLEEETAAILGKEAALYVPTGTMANQLAILSQTTSGDEIWVHEGCHLVDGEQGGPAFLARVAPRTFRGSQGALDPEEIRFWLRDWNDPHSSHQVLACVENTIGYDRGQPYPLERLAELHAFVAPRGIRIHCDGSRLWNAAVATGTAPAELASLADTVAVCFSKGLGAPVGSALAGTAETIARARRTRKLLGGGMRQAGIIAAGALYALRHHRDRLADDHRRARDLAALIADAPGVEIDPERVETNFAIARVEGSPAEVADLITRAGVACLPYHHDTIRFVTHLGIDDEAIEEAGARVMDALGAQRRSHERSGGV